LTSSLDPAVNRAAVLLSADKLKDIESGLAVALNLFQS
jgi:hypothetical protein